MELHLFEFIFSSVWKVQPYSYFNHSGEYNTKDQILNLHTRKKTHTLLHLRTQNSSLVLDFHTAYSRLLWELSIYGSYRVSRSAMMLTLSWTLKMLCKLSIIKTSFMVCNWVFQDSLYSDSSFSFLTIHLKLYSIQSKYIELIRVLQISSLNLSCVSVHAFASSASYIFLTSQELWHSVF